MWGLWVTWEERGALRRVVEQREDWTEVLRYLAVVDSGWKLCDGDTSICI